jgi:hypothetical protein
MNSTLCTRLTKLRKTHLFYRSYREWCGTLAVRVDLLGIQTCVTLGPSRLKPAAIEELIQRLKVMMGTRSSVGVSLPQQQQMLRDASGENEEGVRFEIQNPNRLHNVVLFFR